MGAAYLATDLKHGRDVDAIVRQEKSRGLGGSTRRGGRAV
jgi:hypothetical protein